MVLVAISRYLAEEVHLGRRDALIVPRSSEGSFTAACPLSVIQSLHHVVHAASLSFAAACPLSVLWSLHHVAHAPSLSFSAVA